MADLKLGKLPDRTPIKLSITISPGLAAALADYAAVYEGAYGQREAVVDLIPAMLESFLANDREFLKLRKSAGGGE